MRSTLTTGPNFGDHLYNPAPRWSAYVFDLRGMGVEIETIHEPHEGDFPGHHARYVLRSSVTLGRIGDAV